MRTLMAVALLLLIVVGCDLARPPIDEVIARDIATYSADYDFTGLHEIRRVTIGTDTYALLLGTRSDGLRGIGLLGYHADGMGFDADWDAAEAGVTVTFSVDRQGVGDRSGGTLWTARAFGIVSDPRITTVRVVTDDGATTEFSVEQPGYVFKMPATATGGIRAVFFDAAGLEVASLPTDD
jgi:hypothetical protein